VLRTGIYIASLPPLGHHHSLQTYQYTPISTPTACPGRDKFDNRGSRANLDCESSLTGQIVSASPITGLLVNGNYFNHF
jgi:hypothetical protein